MDANKFNSLMASYGVAYVYYTQNRGTKQQSYVVGTTDFSDKYIQAKMKENEVLYGKPTPDLEPGEVLIFSYSKDKFRKLPLAAIKRVTALAVELKKVDNVSRRY